MADFFCKLFFLGDPCTGKTALISKLAEKSVSGDYRMSVGLPKTACFLQSENGTVRFELMENPGHDEFSSNTRLFYRAAHGVLIVYSVGSAASFQGAGRWVAEVQQFAKPNVAKVLVGCSNGSVREVSYEEGSSFAASHGLVFLEFDLAGDLDAPTVLTALLHLSHVTA